MRPSKHPVADYKARNNLLTHHQHIAPDTALAITVWSARLNLAFRHLAGFVVLFTP